jgi:hypothetical protein
LSGAFDLPVLPLTIAAPAAHVKAAGRAATNRGVDEGRPFSRDCLAIFDSPRPLLARGRPAYCLPLKVTAPLAVIFAASASGRRQLRSKRPSATGLSKESLKRM